MLIKLGELIDISSIEETSSCISMVSDEVLENFKKTAGSLRKIAPKADDFLYFVAVMMHAAEAVAINPDGSPKLTARGEPVKVGWDTRGGTWRWQTNDPNIMPLKNANHDIFPEIELIKAHKKWIHKPLCVDHKSNSVDHTRGFIVDTYYDRNLKRVIALCALDKANYPDLARKVATRMQTAVSMGVGVSAAICTECAKVARVEADFCNHMRNKSGYGEINTGLNPIELSIVVNGADPDAQIKEIFASANTLNAYVDSKATQLSKIADLRFEANIVVSDEEQEEGPKQSQISISSDSIDQFKKDLADATAKLENIYNSVKNVEKDTNDIAFNQSSGTFAMDETSIPQTDTSLAPPNARYAETDELKTVLTSIGQKLDDLKNKLSIFTNKHEENMSSQAMNKKGYYQGTEEPTPGQPTYEKDPLNEKARSEDKQMNGEGPFPSVGAVDGMHPSPQSAGGGDELERKKMLARAAAEERAIKRQAAADLAKKALEDKKAYFQNGLEASNVNTPAPHKVKYPIDKLNEQARAKEDKQMVGQKPFPGVGDVEGLHPSPESAEPSDELKRKEMLRRANTLHGRFVRASKSDGALDIDNSTWEVRRGDDLLLTASVKELSGGRSELMYDSINTPEFGQKLLEKVKVYGAEKAKTLIKSGQDASSAPAAPSAPPPAAPVEPVPANVGEDTGKDGDPKENALSLAETVRDTSSDLVEAVRSLTGEQAEMGAGTADGIAASAATDFNTLHLNALREEITSSLISEMNTVIAKLNSHEEELKSIAGVYGKTITASAKDLLNPVAEDAMNEAKSAVAEGLELLSAFVKFANGTNELVKRAKIDEELKALAEGETMDNDDDLMNLIHETDSELDDVKNMMDDEHTGISDEGLDGIDGLGDSDLDLGTDSDVVLPDDNSLMATPDEVKAGKLNNVPAGTDVKITSASFDTKASRAALRAKLAYDATGKLDEGKLEDASRMKLSPMLEEHHRLTDGQTKLDTKPSDNLGYVEDLEERNKIMLDVAKAPPKVRKEAEVLNKLVSEGKTDPSEFDSLIAQGLDKDVVAYWKKYYGQVEGGSEFATELLKEHAKASLEEDMNNYRVKLARAYEMTYDMVSRGLCHDDRVSISSQVDEIMKFNDEGFETLKRVVARHSPIIRKEASRLPNVGLIGSGDVVSTPVEDEWASLSAKLGTKKRMF
jgi:hypothetical protein